MPRVPTIPQSLRRACRDVLSIASHANGSGVIGLISSSPCRACRRSPSVWLASSLRRRTCCWLTRAEASRCRRLWKSTTCFGCRGPRSTAPPQPRRLDCPMPALPFRSLDAGYRAALGNYVGEAIGRAQADACEALSARRDRFGIVETQFSPGWSACLDHTYLVVDMSRTRVKSLYRARRELDYLRMPIAGAILNRRTFSVPAFMGGERS